MLLLHGALVLLMPARRLADSVAPTYIQMLPPIPAAKPVSPPPAARSSAAPAPLRRQAAAVAPPEPAITLAPVAPPPAEEAVDPLELPVEQMRRSAGAIDRELRKGKLAPLNAADTPMARFRAGADDARVGSGNGVFLERSVAADGVPTTRVTIGGKAVCYRSSYVNASHSAMLRGGAPSAVKVQCPPADAVWVRH